GHASDDVRLEEQARIPALKVLQRATERAPRHDSIRVEEGPVSSLDSLYPIGDAGERETGRQCPGPFLSLFPFCVCICPLGGKRTGTHAKRGAADREASSSSVGIPSRSRGI